MALQVHPGPHSDVEVDTPSWINCILPPLKEPEDRTSWCRDCQTIPEERLRELLLSFDNFESFGTEGFPSKKDPKCALCNILPLLENRWPGNFSSVDLTQHPGRDGRILVRNTQIKVLEKAGSFVMRVTRDPELASQDTSEQAISSTVTCSANFANLREKMAHCAASHGGKCINGSSGAMNELSLINCATRTIEPSGDGKKYAALSYVWGSMPSSGSIQSGKLVGPLERTIEDALVAAKEMGLEYLWVDRYCIDQDSTEKHHQIKQMDLVYRNAVMTIVAAAGDDASHGLPGVSIRRKSAVRSCRIGNTILFKGHPCGPGAYVIRSVTKSKWKSRAWTLQEALFSRKFLIFTDFGASFYCPGMGICSGVETQPLNSPVNIGSELHYMGAGADHDLELYIEEYTKRSLTYPDDALNGFLGILRAYQAKQPPAQHFWGVPILPQVTCPEPTIERFLRGMSWQLRQPGSRRPCFPSWSWAGWEGTVDTARMRRHGNLFGEWMQPVQIQVEAEAGEIFKWSEFENREFLKDESIDSLSPVIHIQAWAIEVTIREITLKESSHLGEAGISRLCAEYEDRKGCIFLSPLWMDDKSSDDPEEIVKLRGSMFSGIILNSRPWRGRDVSAILVRENCGIAERFAIFGLGDGRDQNLTRQCRREDNKEDFDMVWCSTKLG